MKTAEYKLAGDIPEALKGKLIKTREAESLEQMHELVDEGKPENVLALAQAQYDIIVQRKIREAVNGEIVAAILAGKTAEVGGENLDFSQASDEERVEHALQFAQGIADDYAYGKRSTIPGGGAKAAKKAVQDITQLRSAASNDPDLAAKLAALGITL